MLGIGKLENQNYLLGAKSDWFFILLAPVFSLAFVLTHLSYANKDLNFIGITVPVMAIIYFFVQGFADSTTVFRAYLNPTVFKTFWFRLGVVPPILILFCTISDTFFIFLFIFEVFYDIWHSSLQTWGIGRIYDVKIGNDPNKGRSEDRILNLIIYALPILAGIHLGTILKVLELSQFTALPWLAHVPAVYVDIAEAFSATLIVLSLAYLIYYVYRYRKLCSEGYIISPQKLVMLFTVALLCFYCGWFASFAAFYLGINIFHSLHTIFIAWWSERKTVLKSLKLDKLKNPHIMSLFIFILAIIITGQGEIVADYYEENLYEGMTMGGNFNLIEYNSGVIGWVLRLRLVITFMHYWSDSFIWSLRKKTHTFQNE